MPPAKHEEIFDSDDDEDLSPEGSYTSVTLGVPDGDVESETELRDPRVSRIGGKPVRHFSSFCNYIDQCIIFEGIRCGIAS